MTRRPTPVSRSRPGLGRSHLWLALYAAVLVGVLVGSSFGLVRAVADNLRTVAALQDYHGFGLPVALLASEPNKFCGPDLLRSIERMDRGEPFTPAYVLQWAAVCRVPLDLRIEDRIERPTDLLFAGATAFRVAGLPEALTIWREHPALSGYFAELAVESLTQNRDTEARWYRDLAASISLDALQGNYSFNRRTCLHYRRQKSWEQALPYCQAGADLQGADRDWLTLGLVQAQLGLYQDALQSYGRIDSPASRYEQAQIFQVLGDSLRAERLLLEVIDEDLQLARKATLSLVQLYLDEDRWCDARNLVGTVFSDACAQGDGSVPRRYCRLLAQPAPADCE